MYLWVSRSVRFDQHIRFLYRAFLWLWLLLLVLLLLLLIIIIIIYYYYYFIVFFFRKLRIRTGNVHLLLAVTSPKMFFIQFYLVTAVFPENHKCVSLLLFTNEFVWIDWSYCGQRWLSRKFELPLQRRLRGKERLAALLQCLVCIVLKVDLLNRFRKNPRDSCTTNSALREMPLEFP